MATLPRRLVSYISTAGVGIPGTIYFATRVPNTRDGGYHPHLIHILVPNGSHSSALITLHGGSGTNTNILRQLGLVRTPSDTSFTASQVFWPLLQAFGNVVVAAPQGWIDPRTYSSTYPNGVASWDNHFMNAGALAAGYDDVQMLKDLRTYLRSTFSLSGVSLFGHSNGGMMVNRMMLEANVFTHYLSCSGPCPDYWNSHSHTFPDKPYFAQYGAQDDVLNIIGSGWTSSLWNQTTSTLSVADNSFPALGHTIGDYFNLQRRVTDAGSSETVSYGDGITTSVVTGVSTEWTYNSGRTKLQLLSAAGHDIKSHQQCSGARVFGKFMKFVVAT